MKLKDVAMPPIILGEADYKWLAEAAAKSPQQPSTQAIITRDPKDDIIAQLRTVSTDGQPTNKLTKAADIEKWVRPRGLGLEETLVYLRNRATIKNSGTQSTERGVTKESIEKAIEAFMNTPGVAASILTETERKRVFTYFARTYGWTEEEAKAKNVGNIRTVQEFERIMQENKLENFDDALAYVTADGND